MKSTPQWELDTGLASAKLVARPYLVSQTFNGLAFREYLLGELAKIFVIPVEPISAAILTQTYQMQARPDMERVPFSGIQVASFILRPQFTRRSPADQLMVRYNFVKRSDVWLFIGAGNDEVMVTAVFNASTYPPAPLPTSQSAVHSLSEIRASLPEVGETIDGILAGGALSVNPLGDVILQKGFETDEYVLPAYVDAPLGTWSLAFPPPSDAAQSPSRIERTDNGQPYPLRGTIEVKWEHAGS